MIRILLLYGSSFIVPYMTTFVKRGVLINYPHYVKLCIDIPEGRLSIDRNMYTCKGIKEYIEFELCQTGHVSSIIN